MVIVNEASFCHSSVSKDIQPDFFTESHIITIPFLWLATTHIMNLYIKIPLPLEPSVSVICSHGATEPYAIRTDNIDWIVHTKGAWG